jgi:hypothetical protein
MHFGKYLKILFNASFVAFIAFGAWWSYLGKTSPETVIAITTGGKLRMPAELPPSAPEKLPATGSSQGLRQDFNNSRSVDASDNAIALRKSTDNDYSDFGQPTMKLPGDDTSNEY